MTKPFLTYNQQIDKLTNEKKLQIPDIEKARETLKDIGYFSLINCTPFSPSGSKAISARSFPR